MQFFNLWTKTIVFNDIDDNGLLKVEFRVCKLYGANPMDSV